jgi:hydrogenase-1 operon protein HyaE
MLNAPLAATPSTGADAPLHPLVRRLLDCQGYAYVERLDALARDPRNLLLFLPAHGKAHVETPDVAVVLPELVKALDAGAGRVTGAVASPAVEAALRERLSLALPAIVVLKGGEPVGAVARMRDWDVYLTRLAALLAAPVPTH